MKKRLLCILLVAALTLGVFNVHALAVEIGIKLNKSSANMYVNDTMPLKVITNSKKAVTWKSSDETIARVSKSGLVTARKKGTATITATAEGKSAVCKVTIKNTVYGNTNGNIVNGGWVAQNDGWIYYKNSGDNYYLYKMQPDGSQKTLITKSTPSCINVVDGWIYFINTDDNDSIYKVTTSGKNKTKLLSSTAKNLIVSGNWLYFIASGGKICRMRTDGTGQKVLNRTDTANEINVVGSWIYYTTDKSIFKMGVAGTSRTQILTTEAKSLNVNSGWVYFINYDTIYKVKTNGSNKQEITSATYLNPYINVSGNYIYYSIPDRFIGSKISIDGAETELNCPWKSAEKICLAGNWVYYEDRYGDLYRTSKSDKSYSPEKV